MFAGWDIHEKLSAIGRSSISTMPYVPHWPTVPDWSPMLPLLFWLPLGLLMAIGVAPRVVGALLVLTMTVILLGDQRTYSNHLYFLILLVFLLSFVPSSRRQTAVRSWPVTLLKCQGSVLYGFGALSKVTPMYLTGWMLAGTVDRRWWGWIPEWSESPLIFAGIALLTIVVEAWLAAALWSPRFRRAAVVTGLTLHAGCVLLLRDVKIDLIVFGLSSVSLYPLFFLSPAHEISTPGLRPGRILNTDPAATAI